MPLRAAEYTLMRGELWTSAVGGQLLPCWADKVLHSSTPYGVSGS